MNENTTKKIRNALLSVYHKDRLETIVYLLNELGITIYSTGGTLDFIKGLYIEARSVESLTGYPPILGGRVKTLHPKIFGGILARRNNSEDCNQLTTYNIPPIDLVIVDLYPFEETVRSGAGEQSIIEKIDIGGISLIRAAAKNYQDTLVVSSRDQYDVLMDILKNKHGETTMDVRRNFATKAFRASSEYDALIFNYFDAQKEFSFFQQMNEGSMSLRYGENPHQEATFFGHFNQMFEQLHGKELSYNNLLDIDAAVALINDFTEPTYAILKHNNACGCASDSVPLSAWYKALAGDPVSAYGGIVITNQPVDKSCATEINKLFVEVIIAPGYSADALKILKSKKNRILLTQKQTELPIRQFRSLLNGIIQQTRDTATETAMEMNLVTVKKTTEQEIIDLIFANKLVKHSKSNAIVFVKEQQMIASGIGQTSRIDALKQAIVKAQSFGFSLHGAVMASDAFFPFPDCVEIAHQAGITAIVQPGGSVKDNESIDYCNNNHIAMLYTGIRHFKH